MTWLPFRLKSSLNYSESRNRFQPLPVFTEDLIIRECSRLAPQSPALPSCPSKSLLLAVRLSDPDLMSHQDQFDTRPSATTMLLSLKPKFGSHLPFLVEDFPAPGADPSLRGWEGGISGRGVVPAAVPGGAGASRNYAGKPGLRRSNLIAKVIVRVITRVIKSTINFCITLTIRLHISLVSADSTV